MVVLNEMKSQSINEIKLIKKSTKETPDISLILSNNERLLILNSKRELTFHHFDSHSIMNDPTRLNSQGMNENLF